MVLLLFVPVLKTNPCQSDVRCQKTSLASGGGKASAKHQQVQTRLSPEGLQGSWWAGAAETLAVTIIDDYG